MSGTVASFAVKAVIVTICVCLVLRVANLIFDADAEIATNSLCYYAEGYYSKGAFLQIEGVFMQCAPAPDAPDGPLEWITPR